MIGEIGRRGVISGVISGIAVALSLPLGWVSPSQARTRKAKGESAMNVVCQIRYQIDPFKKKEFEEYSRNWLSIIPAAGGELLGYFMPHEGTNDVAFAMIGFDSLAAYEAYRAKLKTDPKSVANFNFAEKEQFILREERVFLRPVRAS